MKKVLSLLIMFSIFSLSAQDSTKSEWGDPVKHEFGTDITALISNAVSFGFGPAPVTPFQFIYRFHINNKIALREQIGGNYSSTTGYNNDTNAVNYRNSLLIFQTGIEFKKQLSKRWQMYSGVDLGYSLTSYSALYEGVSFPPYNWESIYEGKTHSTNFSPLLGIRFHLSPNISLTTETAINLNYSWDNSAQTITYPNLPANNSSTTSESNTLGVNMTAPFKLYLNISF